MRVKTRVKMVKAEVSFKLHRRKYVVCRLKVNKTHDEFHTGLTADPNRWSAGQPTGRSSAELQLKADLEDIKSVIRDYTIYPETTAAELKNKYQGKSSFEIKGIPGTIKEVIEYHNKAKRESRQHAQNSIDFYDKILNSFSKYLEQNNIIDIALERLTRNDIRYYHTWLQQNNVKSEYSRYQYCTGISTCIDFVLKEFSDRPEAMKYNPVKGTISRPKKNKLKAKSRANHLPFDFDETIVSTDMPGELRGYSKEWWKWTAIFQIRSGFSFVDLGNDHWEIVKTLQGDVIEFYRVKSYEPSIIPILPALKECINKLRAFRRAHKSDRLFPIRKFVNQENNDKDMRVYNSDYNQYDRFLEDLAKETNSPVPINSHTLRHTFGMVMINVHGYSTEDVAVMMGHTDLRTTTDNYTYVTRERILEKTQKLIG